MNKPTYSASNGKRYTQSQIDYRIRKAGLDCVNMQFIEHGYNFCERCGRNSMNTRIDVSHTISRKDAKNNGMVEVLWNQNNLEILCRDCHKTKDGLNIFH